MENNFNLDDFDLNLNSNQYSDYNSYVQGNSPSQNFQQSFYANSTVCEDVEDSVPETQPPIMTHPLPVRPNQRIPEAVASRSWSIQEDEVLVAGYMTYCTDVVLGTDQKAIDIWKQVSAYYDKVQEERPYEVAKRGLRMLESHWRRIAADVQLWAASFEKDEDLFAKSGNSNGDVYSIAQKLFRDSVKSGPKNFTCEHAWKMVCDQPKWRRRMRWGISKEERELRDNVEGTPQDSEGSGKRTRLDDDGNNVLGSGESFVSGGLNRPDGVKKTKARRKGKGASSSEAVSSFGDSLQANTAMRLQENQTRQRRLEFDMLREARMKQQVEIEARHVQVSETNVEIERKRLEMEPMKMKNEFLQILMSKGNLTAFEEQTKERLITELYGGTN
ncbi:glutathione S-transferase T3-like [Spinacia oleracea]|uniref:Glutathione S-transferase T3-like n=1 Tax=Spinacia oleracea TaxID=3562 RepID=A0A9R0IR96_SPIOL|nr:glutathione S-transferase T3-like [Spinacia oleracea]